MHQQRLVEGVEDHLEEGHDQQLGCGNSADQRAETDEDGTGSELGRDQLHDPQLQLVPGLVFDKHAAEEPTGEHGPEAA